MKQEKDIFKIEELNIKEGNIPNLRVYENTTLYGSIERLPEEILEILMKKL